MKINYLLLNLGRYLASCLGFSTLVLASCITFAQDDLDAGAETQKQTDISEIESVISALTTARGEFEQIIREQDGYVLDRQTGSFALERPRKLHWQISELDQLLIGDGEQLYLYDELFEQVIIREWSSDPSLNPAAILLEDIRLQDWARVETAGNNLKLIPTGDIAAILEIELSMSQGFPNMLTLLDTTGQTTEIRFSEVEQNIELEPELFRFDIPSGVEVIYEE